MTDLGQGSPEHSSDVQQTRVMLSAEDKEPCGSETVRYVCCLQVTAAARICVNY